VDPEFQRVLLRVLLIGGVIGALSAGGLVIAFRAFGTVRKETEMMPVVLTAAVLLFVIVASLVLLRISVAK
jgi:hypothetical protein